MAEPTASGGGTATAAPAHHWWLVGNPGNEPSGNPAKIVESTGKPAGYSYVADLGTTLADVESKLVSAVVNAPNGVSIPSDFGNVPGLGTTTIKGPGGVAGALDTGATTAGNAVTSLANITSVLGDLQFWKGIGLVIAGFVILVIAGLELRKL